MPSKTLSSTSLVQIYQLDFHIATGDGAKDHPLKATSSLDPQISKCRHYVQRSIVSGSLGKNRPLGRFGNTLWRISVLVCSSSIDVDAC
jgi:hypothetical protein